MDDGILDGMRHMIEDAMENAMAGLRDEMSEIVQEAVNDSLSEIVSEALEAFFSAHSFKMPDGTVLQPKEHLKVLSPDKRKLLPCYGGLKVDGKTLVIQSGISRWEALCYYSTAQEAAAALLRIKDAMQSGMKYLEL